MEFKRFFTRCLSGALLMSMLLPAVCSGGSPVEASPSPQEQMIAGFGDLLGFRHAEDPEAKVILEKAAGSIFKDLELQGTVLKFVDEPNPAGAITASQPSHCSPVVSIAINRKLIVETFKHPSERVEMTWFALLHELQNALRAAEFKALSQKAMSGELGEEEFVRGEIETEWDSLKAAHSIYMSVVWPGLVTVGLQPEGRVQKGYEGLEKWKKEEAVNSYMRSEVGAYYRECYAEQRQMGRNAEKKKQQEQEKAQAQAQ